MSVPPSVQGALRSGDRLGPYRIVRRLGVGGMGIVYEAVDESLGRSVAVKVIGEALAAAPVFRARFAAEAKAQASLDSPHVVQVFAHGEIDGRLYIATQLIPDGDLGRMLRLHGAPPPGIAVDLVAQVAAGLTEAHRVGLVHRDIKPANVLIRNRGDEVSAYLADFGISRRVDVRQGPTTEGLAVGTPSYMAPELHTGGSPGPATDIYSLGCLLWATLSGRAPYAGTTDYEVVSAHVSAPIPQLAERGAFEREANRILRRAMAKSPAERYPAAALLRDDLRALAASAPAPRSAAGGPRGGRRTAVVAVALAVVAVLVVAGGVTAAVLATRGGPPGHDPSSGTTTSREQQAVDNITESLEADGHLDPTAARCTAQKLVDKRGIAGLRQAGLLDSRLGLRRGGDGQVAPGVLADVFTSSFSCVWRTATAHPS
ncbi:MAG: serine/threonine protein kinase [Nocardioidaceae bacterium]|nr:serine/threonine protein kinase [Nocardioidaceae bacterium]MCL2612952.1 serine/threonine protein kinase [Nocardioidaceae bacterium]